MHRLTISSCAALSLCAATSVLGADRLVVVTITNRAPDAGTFQTPVWVGFHDGLFDSYDSGTLADSLPIPGSDALERIAEDGNAGPLSIDFTTVVPDGVQRTVAANGAVPVLAPGQSVSRLFTVDTDVNRYFSYVSMVIPSNDAFIANGSPTAHPIFNDLGRWVAEDFTVSGAAVNDAGTELNDELPEHTAFFGQSMPDTGIVEGANIFDHAGFIPGGPILSDPMFANADFLAPGYEMLEVSFTRLPAGARFIAALSPDAEVGDPVESDGFGISIVRRDPARGELRLVTFALNLTGPVTSAHLHLGRADENGPVVVDLTSQVMNFGPLAQITARITDDDLLDALEGLEDPVNALVAEMAGEQIYLNLHTAAFPGGELRGQVLLIQN